MVQVLVRRREVVEEAALVDHLEEAVAGVDQKAHRIQVEGEVEGEHLGSRTMAWEELEEEEGGKLLKASGVEVAARI